MILLVDRPTLAEGDVNTGEFCTARWITPVHTRTVQCTLHIHVRRQRKRRVKHNHGPIVVSIFLSVSYGQNFHSVYWRSQREDSHLLLSLIEMHFQYLCPAPDCPGNRVCQPIPSQGRRSHLSLCLNTDWILSIVC